MNVLQKLWTWWVALVCPSNTPKLPPAPDAFVDEYFAAAPEVKAYFTAQARIARARQAVAENTDMRTALEGSIAKWENILAGKELDEGSYNCPLCQHYCHYSIAGNWCQLCPVAIATGDSGCNGSPYKQYSALADKLHVPNDGRHHEVDRKTPKALRTIIQAELNFLKGLRP